MKGGITRVVVGERERGSERQTFFSCQFTSQVATDRAGPDEVPNLELLVNVSVSGGVPSTWISFCCFLGASTGVNLERGIWYSYMGCWHDNDSLIHGTTMPVSQRKI